MLTAAVPASALAISRADPARVEVYLLACTVIGLALVYAGLRDHRLLVASMHGTEPRQERPRRRGTFEVGTLALLLAAGGTLLLRLEPRTATHTMPLVLWSLVISYQVIVAMPAAVRSIREFSRNSRVTELEGLRLDLRPETLVAMFAAALAVALESTFAMPGLVAVTLAIAIGWTALRTRPVRPLYVLASGLFGVAGALSLNGEPPHAYGRLPDRRQPRDDSQSAR